MTRDEIIRMAHSCGFNQEDHHAIYSNLTVFAKLVASAEREACAKLCGELAELNRSSPTDSLWQWGECAAAIRARGGV